MNINRVVLSGNLTRDPDLRTTGSGFSVCKLGVACNTRKKNSATGEWEEKPNYFRVTVFGKQGENCAQWLKKGRGVMIDGRLEWSQWEAEDGQKRESVDIIADAVQFIADGRGDGNGGGSGGGSGRPAATDVPIDTRDFDAVAVAPVPDDDIPF